MNTPDCAGPGHDWELQSCLRDFIHRFRQVNKQNRRSILSRYNYSTKSAYQQYIKSQLDKDQFSSSDNEGIKEMMNPRLSMN